MATLSMPRLLPVTIAALAATLAMRSIALVQAALPAASPQSAVVAAAQAAPSPKPTPPPRPTPHAAATLPDPAPRPVSDAERAVLLDLRQRSEQIDARATALKQRESVLAAAEQKLKGRVQQLLALQQRLEALEAARKQREELGWQGLVKVYEVMKPRDAATIFNDLQMTVLLPVLDRMKERNAAPILAAMNPDKARDVTAALAKLRTDRNAAAQPGG